MQYILTEAEYKALKEEGRNQTEKQTKILQDLCTKVCDHMPIKYWNNKEEQPWRCMKTVEALKNTEDGYGGEWYCDECPVEKVCPECYKKFSQ